MSVSLVAMALVVTSVVVVVESGFGGSTTTASNHNRRRRRRRHRRRRRQHRRRRLRWRRRRLRWRRWLRWGPATVAGGASPANSGMCSEARRHGLPLGPAPRDCPRFQTQASTPHPLQQQSTDVAQRHAAAGLGSARRADIACALPGAPLGKRELARRPDPLRVRPAQRSLQQWACEPWQPRPPPDC